MRASGLTCEMVLKNTRPIKALDGNENILVIKHGALGDIIQAIDAFESLRLSLPNPE